MDFTFPSLCGPFETPVSGPVDWPGTGGVGDDVRPGISPDVQLDEVPVNPNNSADLARAITFISLQDTDPIEFGQSFISAASSQDDIERTAINIIPWPRAQVIAMIVFKTERKRDDYITNRMCQALGEVTAHAANVRRISVTLFFTLAHNPTNNTRTLRNYLETFVKVGG